MENVKNEKCKILLYTDTAQLGGAEKHMYLLAKFLDPEHFQVSLACTDSPELSGWIKKFESIGIQVFRIKVGHKHDPRHFLQLKKILEKESFDLLHIHIWNPASNRYALLASKFVKIPTIITEHDPFQLSSLKHWLKKKLISHVKGMITISHDNDQLTKKLFPELKNRTRLIHNGIDVTAFSSQLLSFSESDREKLRKDVLQSDKKTDVIITIAELHPRKGLMTLLESAKLLTEQEQNFMLIIVGKGEQEAELRQYIAKNNLENHALLLGYRYDIPQLLAGSDLFILPSLHEAFGLVILEAMAAGLPIVATRSGGIPDIITEEENGILVPPKDSNALANAIKTLLSDKKRMKTMSSENYNKVSKQFDIKEMVKKTEEFYSAVMEDSKYEKSDT